MTRRTTVAVAPDDTGYDTADAGAPESATPEDMPDGVEQAKEDITLDLSDPSVAEQFANCEVGETLTVKSKDENTIVLSKEGYGDETTEGSETPEGTTPEENMEGDEGEGMTGVDELVRRKSRA